MARSTIARYQGSLALLTDLYELTMAYGFWKSGIHERDAAFHLFYRTEPFGGAFTVACGVAQAIDWLEDKSKGSGLIDLYYA